MRFSWVLLWTLLLGCGGDEATPVTSAMDAAMGMDSGMMNPPPMPIDAGRNLDARPARDMTPVRQDRGLPPDLGPQPDVGPLDGAPCDPRRLAAACEEPGHFCVHVPGAREDMGRCQEGDGCRPGVEGDCPPERPYCHLRGGGTFCTEVGDIEAGQDCVNELGIPQPCVDGQVCNNSVCQPPCVPGEEPTGCPDEGRCADITDTIGVAGGLCAPRNCNWFTGEGCEAGEKCRYTFRADGTLVGSCSALDGPGNPEGSPCDIAMDNCGQGLVCIGPEGQQRVCLMLCDTGGYEAPCASGRRCDERLATRNGVVRGYGLCITNQ